MARYVKTKVTPSISGWVHKVAHKDLTEVQFRQMPMDSMPEIARSLSSTSERTFGEVASYPEQEWYPALFEEDIEWETDGWSLPVFVTRVDLRGMNTPVLAKIFDQSRSDYHLVLFIEP